MAAARYAVHTQKALEAILFVSNASPGMDVYHVARAVFDAERYHLNKYGRPIAGDDYQADTYGPLGRTVYGLVTNDPIAMLALGTNGPLPFNIMDGWRVAAGRDANVRLLSESDREALAQAVAKVAGHSFGELVTEARADKAYAAANGGPIHYEDMLSGDDPDHAGKAADLKESAPFAVF